MTNLRKIRKGSGITQEELANRLGVSRRAVVCREARGIVRAATAQRYAVVLGCPPFQLLER